MAMVSNIINQKKSARALSNSAKCPACDVMVNGTVKDLLMHFEDTHKRKPTEAEVFQFRSYKRKDFKSNKYKIGYFKNPIEVSGGLPSLGKRR